MGEGMAWGGACSFHCLTLDDGDIQGSITSLRPVGNQHICWSPVGAREEVLTLLYRVENRSGGHAVDVIAQMVVPGDSFTPGATAQSTEPNTSLAL